MIGEVKMKSGVWKIDDGADHWVIAVDEKEAIEAWRKAVRAAGEEPIPLEEVSVGELQPDWPLNFHFEGRKITHTAEEWYAIYCGTGHHYIGCSEW